MARVKGAMMTRKRRKKILKRAKGYWGSKSTHFRVANQAVMKSLKYAYIGRKHKKRDFRRLWIQRINAASRAQGLTYNRLIQGLNLAGVAMAFGIAGQMLTPTHMCLVITVDYFKANFFKTLKPVLLCEIIILTLFTAYTYFTW